jgi:hypothetical protein
MPTSGCYWGYRPPQSRDVAPLTGCGDDLTAPTLMVGSPSILKGENIWLG